MHEMCDTRDTYQFANKKKTGLRHDPQGPLRELAACNSKARVQMNIGNNHHYISVYIYIYICRDIVEYIITYIHRHTHTHTHIHIIHI